MKGMQMQVMILVFAVGSFSSGGAHNHRDTRELLFRYNELLGKYLEILSEWKYIISRELAHAQNAQTESSEESGDDYEVNLNKMNRSLSATESNDQETTTFSHDSASNSSYLEELLTPLPENSTAATDDSSRRRRNSPTEPRFQIKNILTILENIIQLTSEIDSGQLTPENIKELSSLLNQLADIPINITIKEEDPNYNDFFVLKNKLEEAHTKVYESKRNLKVTGGPPEGGGNDSDDLLGRLNRSHILIIGVIVFFVSLAFIVSCCCFVHKWKQSRALSNMIKSLDVEQPKNIIRCYELELNPTSLRKALSDSMITSRGEEKPPVSKSRKWPATLVLEDAAALYKHSSTDALGDPMDDVIYRRERCDRRRISLDREVSPILDRCIRKGRTKLMRYDPETLQLESPRRKNWCDQGSSFVY